MRPVPFKEALAYAERQNVVLTDEYYGERIGLARAQARTISGLAGVDQIQHVFDLLDAEMKNGGTFQSFRKAVAAGEIDIALPRHHLELIHRNNIQSAYAAGRWQQVQSNKANRPYLEYIAVNDGRTRPSHRRMHGHIAAVDDPWWATHHPLNGYRCRCSTRSVSAAEAKRKGIKPAPKAEPDKGWEYNPGMAPMEGLKQAAKQKKAVVHPKLRGVVDKAVVSNTRPQTPKQAKEIGAAIRQKIEQSGPVTVDAVFSELTRIRSFDKVTADVGNGGKGAKSVVAASLSYPDDWVTIANKAGTTHVRSAKSRGRHYVVNHSHDKKRVRVGGGFGVRTVHAGDSYIITGSHKTSVHEYAHRLQSTIPELDAIFQIEHKARTESDKLRRLRDITGNKAYKVDEVAKEDHYINPYFGREYGKGEAKEVMTMGFQHVLGGKKTEFDDLLNNDKSLFDLVIGLLAAF